MFRPSCALFRRSCALFAGGAAPILQETSCADAPQPSTPIADALVIGGGVVGVAVARDIAVRGDTVVLLVRTPLPMQLLTITERTSDCSGLVSERVSEAVAEQVSQRVI